MNHMKVDEITKLNISQLHQGFKEKKFSVKEVVRAYLEEIQKKEPEINAFLEIDQKLLEKAEEIDEEISQESDFPLLKGIPCAIKDNILVKGFKCTAGSKILENFQAVYDATCIGRLKKEGVIILGKTNLDEFAMGSSTERSAFKITKNPKDLTRVPGGSSGGSAAAVAAEECCFALGSDTGGSIRQPASFCGVVGLKPTYGAVSRYGLIAFASSLDQIGPITKTVEDCEIVFEVIGGKDPKDSTSVEIKSKVKSQKSKLEIENLKIGIPKEYFTEGIEPEVKKVIEATVKKIEKEGAKIEEISLPHTKYAIPCYYIIATSEASANLARYDGIKYGMSKSNLLNSDLLDVYLKTRGEGFGEEVKRRIMLGTYALSAGYYKAFYLRAQKVRTKILEDFQEAFQKVNVIFTPVSPFVAFKIGEKIDNPLQMYLADIFTVSVNLAGLPALSLPCGEVNNLPVGLQIIAPHFQEKLIFEIGKYLEKILE